MVNLDPCHFDALGVELYNNKHALPNKYSKDPTSRSTDNVFAPKTEIEDCEDCDEEREVEAFKRLCFHSHSKHRKSKIKVDLDVDALKSRSRKASSEDKGYGSDKDCSQTCPCLE